MEDNLVVIDQAVSFEREIEPETEIITDRYYIPGEYITFNMNGIAFRFEVFALEVIHKDNKVLDIFIDVDSEVPENLVALMNVMPYPEEYDVIEIIADYYSFRLTLKDEIIEQLINPNIKAEKDLEFQNLFGIKDESTGQYILSDFYYYRFVEVEGA